MYVNHSRYFNVSLVDVSLDVIALHVYCVSLLRLLFCFPGFFKCMKRRIVHPKIKTFNHYLLTLCWWKVGGSFRSFTAKQHCSSLLNNWSFYRLVLKCKKKTRKAHPNGNSALEWINNGWIFNFGWSIALKWRFIRFIFKTENNWLHEFITSGELSYCVQVPQQTYDSFLCKIFLQAVNMACMLCTGYVLMLIVLFLVANFFQIHVVFEQLLERVFK